MSTQRYNGTSAHGATDEQIIERCAYLHGRGIYPSKVACAVSCENGRFSRVRRFWAEQNGVALTRRSEDADRHIANPLSSDEEIIERCQDLVARGIYPSHNASGLGGDDDRFIAVRNAWVKREKITLPTIQREPRQHEEPRSHNGHAEQEQAKPKKPKWATREWAKISQILKKMGGSIVAKSDAV